MLATAIETERRRAHGHARTPSAVRRGQTTVINAYAGQREHRERSPSGGWRRGWITFADDGRMRVHQTLTEPLKGGGSLESLSVTAAEDLFTDEGAEK